jgi:hypothetical protein
VSFGFYIALEEWHHGFTGAVVPDVKLISASCAFHARGNRCIKKEHLLAGNVTAEDLGLEPVHDDKDTVAS